MTSHDEPLSSSFAYEALPSLPEEAAPLQELVGSDSYEWEAVGDLDQFFQRVYRYYEEKGFAVIFVARVLHLATLGFTICFSGFLLQCVQWSALQSECIYADTCDIAEVAIDMHPWRHGATAWNVLCSLYLAISFLYWLWTLGHTLHDVRAAADIRHFTTHRLGLSERQLQTVTWPEVARRIVSVQSTARLCLVRDLNEHDVVSRIMRRENYLIGMLNKGVLALHVQLPGTRRRLMLTETLQWNLHKCILEAMFGDDFKVKDSFQTDEAALQQRFRLFAVFNLLVSPFLLLFLLIYIFLSHAERLYHQPGSVGARRWSSLAAWRLREFNELPHYLQYRLESTHQPAKGLIAQVPLSLLPLKLLLNASHKAAEKYIAQFPSPLLSRTAKFAAFIAGSFAALLLAVTLMDDTLLERHLFGRVLVWWAAVLGVVLAVSRGLITEEEAAFDPELALLEVVAHTHYLPRHWRGRAHTREVQQQFEALFQFKALLFLEEMASILLTPFMLFFTLPRCAPAILRFVRENTVHVEGVGDICSLAAFDFERHGNSKYGSPIGCSKDARSRQGKMEKSFLSFAATYPTWEPSAAAKQMLATVTRGNGALNLAGPHAPYTAMIGSPGASGALRPQTLFAGAASPSMQHAGLLHATALHTRPPRPHPAASQDSCFGSAELASHGGMLGASSVAGDKVATGHMLLQSFYEEQKQEQLRGGALRILHQQQQQQQQAQTACVHDSLQGAPPQPLPQRGLASMPPSFPLVSLPALDQSTALAGGMCPPDQDAAAASEAALQQWQQQRLLADEQQLRTVHPSPLAPSKPVSHHVLIRESELSTLHAHRHSPDPQAPAVSAAAGPAVPL